MQSFVTRIREKYAGGGLGALAQSVLYRVRRFVSIRIFFHRTARLLEWDLTRPVPNVSPPTVDVEVRRLKAEEIPLFTDIVREEKLGLFGERLRDGMICLVAWHKNTVAWYGWVTMKFEHEPWSGVDLQLKEGEGYVLDAFTRPEYRGRNLHSYMSARRLEVLKEMGAVRAYGIAAVPNRASRRAHQKGGCVETKEITYTNVLGFKFHQWKDLK
ncbi:MAG: GNAT family N-acetyltransferase [Candidatus Eisenbacteria bacterium]